MATPGYYPIRGGTETMVHDLAFELNKTGIRTDVMTFNMDRKWNPKWKGKTEKINGITVFRIPALNWLPHSRRINLGINVLPGRFTNILKQYDLIHFHEAEFSFPFFSFFSRKPKLLHLHGIGAGFFKHHRLQRAILKHITDSYIAITKEMERDLIELGISSRRIEYLPNAVNADVFCPKGEKEDNLLLYLGRITPVKGLHILLESLRHLESPVRLVIIGAIWDFEYHQGILEQIQRENEKGKHKIEYLGALSNADVLDWYRKASIFVLPSFWEAFPVTVLEALSCETPPVVTPVGGVPEFIRNFENGLLVPKNNPLKLAEAMQYLLDNRPVRIKLGKAGRKSVVKDFSMEAAAKKLCAIYSKMLSH